MLFSYKIFTFSQLPNKFYNRKILNINLTQPKIKIKTSFIHKLGERRKKEREIKGKREIDQEREDWSGWRQRRLDRVGLGVEWSGLVVSGGQ